MAWRKPQNFREWMRIAFRHRKKFYFPAVTVMIVVILASHRLPRTYTAEAKFQRFNDQTLVQVANRPIQQTLASVRRTLQEEIRGQPAIEQLVEDLQLTRGLPRTPEGELTPEGVRAKYALVKQIQSRVRVGYDINSEQMDQIRVIYSGPERELVPRIANRIVESYVSRTRQQLDEMLLSAKTFFQREVDEMQRRVAELQRAKLEFEMRYPDVSPESPLSIQNRTVELTARQSTLASRLDEAKARKAELQVFLERIPEFAPRSALIRTPEMDELSSRKVQLESELEVQLLELRRTEEHPAVKTLRRRLADVNTRIQKLQQEQGGSDTQKQMYNPDRLQFDEKLHALDGEIKSLNTQLAEVTKSLEQYEDLRRNFFKVRDDYEKIKSDLAEATTRLDFWDQNLRNTTTAWTIEQRNAGVRIRIWQRAQDVTTPSSPNMLRIVGVAVMLGLGVGVLFVLAAELMDHSFRSVEHAVDELKLPVLGTVNEIITPEEAFRRKVFNLGLYPALGGIMLLVLLISLAAANLSLSKPEQFEQLKSSPLQFLKSAVTGR
jgi:uncharacterized protein involved in exopolysaccharide biosynthesis